MKKPYKVLSAVALAALVSPTVLAAPAQAESAPVNIGEVNFGGVAPAISYDRYSLIHSSEEGENYEIYFGENRPLIVAIEINGINVDYDRLSLIMSSTEKSLQELVDEDYELPVYEGEGLTVESVSVINTTKVVTVKATAPDAEEGATATVAIFAYDEEGERAESEIFEDNAVAIEDGAIELEINAVDEGLESGKYVAVVTVGEEEVEFDFTLDFEAVDEAVESVNTANTQIKLWNALQNELFDGVAIEQNIVEYAPIVAKTDYETVAEIIEAVKAINENLAAEKTFDVVKEQLENAFPNQLRIISALEEHFEAVNVDHISAYEDAIFDDTEVDAGITTISEIQYIIYFENAAAAVAEAEVASNDLDGTDGNSTQSEIDKAQVLYDAAFALVDALDPADIGLEGKLDTVQDEIETAQGALDALNDTIEAAETAMTEYLAAGGADDDSVYTDVVDALEADTKDIVDITNKTNALEDATQFLLDNANAGYLAVLDLAEDEDSADVLQALKDLKLANVVDANAEYYYAEVEYQNEEDPAIVWADADIQAEVIAKGNLVADLASASTASEMNNVIAKFATDITEYRNLTAALKADVAEIALFVRDAALEADPDATSTYARLHQDLENIVNDVILALSENGINDPDLNIVGMATLLEENIFTDYAELTQPQKDLVAEYVLNNRPDEGYKTIAAIKEAITAGIAEL